MIRKASGDLFSVGPDVIVNPVNCVGVMGAGLALQIKQRFPWAYEQYVKEWRAGKVAIGRLQVSYNPHGACPGVVLNLPTKRHSKEQSLLDDVEAGIDALRGWAINHPHFHGTVAVPAIGCGLGGLDYADVESLLESYLSTVDGPTWLLFPPSPWQGHLSGI